MILVDPPLWPAHGTHFSHLVSDTSLDELHAFAELIGLSARAHDRDHYDLPVSRYHDAVAAGAREVSPAEVVRALRRAGLRHSKPQALAAVRAREAALRDGWAAMLPRAVDLGDELLQRWSEPLRRYHTPQHLTEVLDAIDAVVADHASDARPERSTRLAAWFHDAVYEGRAGEDEEASARLAEEGLDGLVPAREVEEVARLVRLTAGHRVEDDDRRGEDFIDADLSILGAGEGRYLEYSRQIRAEYHRVPADDFRLGRLAVLEQLAALDPLYRTMGARLWWTDPARHNMVAERERLLAQERRAARQPDVRPSVPSAPSVP